MMPLDLVRPPTRLANERAATDSWLDMLAPWYREEELRGLGEEQARALHVLRQAAGMVVECVTVRLRIADRREVTRIVAVAISHDPLAMQEVVAMMHSRFARHASSDASLKRAVKRLACYPAADAVARTALGE